MKKTFYVLKNNSYSEGNYYLNGEYKSIYPGERLEFTQRPTSITSNVEVAMYRKEVEEPILYLKPKTVKAEKSEKKSQ